MGSMSKIIGMLPGMGQFRDQLENFDEREIDRIQAIIQSMTPGRAGQPEDHRRLAPGPHRQGLRPPGLRRQQPRRPVLRGPQDDDVDGPGRRHAGHARDAGHAGSAAASAPRPSSRPRRARASAVSRQPGQARRRGARRSQSRAAGDGAATRSACRPTRTASFDASLAATCPADLPEVPASSPGDRGMSALRFRGPVLPDGEARDLWVVDGAVTYEPVAARRARRRGLDRPGPGRRALPRRARRERRRRPRTCRSSRRSPTATPARCCCATPARPPTPLDPRPRRPAAADPGRPAHRAAPSATSATTPTRSSRDDLAGVRRPRRPARRRLGQAGRRLDRPRRRRPHARRWPARRARGGDRARRTSTAPG